MHVTARIDYALQAMLALAETDEPTAAVDLAEELDLSYHYLLSIVAELRRAGFVEVRRGRRGGLLLARPATEITLGEIIWAIDGPITLPDGTQADRRREGDDYLRCLWVTAHGAMMEVLGQVRLADARDGRLPQADPEPAPAGR